MKKIRFAITTGDTDGIGLEITKKALNKIGPQKGVQFIVFVSAQTPLKLNSKWNNRVQVQQFNVTDSDLYKFDLIEVRSADSPAAWFEQAAKLAYKKLLTGVITGPLSKTGIQMSGFKDLGHTDILKRITKVKDLRMGFVGKEFNVVLNSGHIPLKSASQAYTYKNLKSSLIHTANLRKLLQDKRSVAIVGINPHAGEEGLIGSEEKGLKKLFQFAKSQSIPLVGPLVPDAAFFKSNWSKYSVYLTAYHDQGLIPFKLVHGQNSGVHVTLGIPFIRTSVDHGTAKDIFEQNKANPRSMLDAITLAISLAKK